jgi:hypothetical protein
VQHHVPVLCDHASEFDVLSGVFLRHADEVGDERLFPLRDHGVVLDVHLSHVFVDGLGGLTLVEHQIVESRHCLFVLLQLLRAHSVASAVALETVRVRLFLNLTAGPGCHVHPHTHSLAYSIVCSADFRADSPKFLIFVFPVSYPAENVGLGLGNPRALTTREIESGGNHAQHTC